MQLWKKRTINRRSLAAPFSINISSSHKGVPLHHQNWRVGDWWWPLLRQQWIQSVQCLWMMIPYQNNDDSLSQRQIALLGISQTTVKKIILRLLSCNFYRGVRLRFYANNPYGRSICVIGLIFSQVM